MKFSVQVKNFGKIKDARINLAPFSVIAGTNSSGKSFLSRALYSFFSTINQDYVTLEAKNNFVNIKMLSKTSHGLLRDPSEKVESLFVNFQNDLSFLEKSLQELGGCTFMEQHTKSLIIMDKITLVEKSLQELLNEIKDKKKYEEFYKRLDASNWSIGALKNIIKKPNEALGIRLATEFKNALKENFQVSTLNELRSFSSDEKISFNFDELGNISIDKESINFSLYPNGISQFQELYNVVFVESPIYWKIRRPLLEIRNRNKNTLWGVKQGEAPLSGVPKFFYDLIDLLNQKNKIDFEGELFIEKILSKIGNILLGELEISDTGDIFFKDKNSDKNVNLNVTATGVTNLGIIALLLKKHVISKGSFVFIDEPEVNLHPAWQKVMIETLYELSKNGINVVVATHSIDMIKYIENIMLNLNDNEIKEHFAINRLSNDGISIVDDLDPKQSLIKIKDDLGESFYNMVLDQGW